MTTRQEQPGLLSQSLANASQAIRSGETTSEALTKMALEKATLLQPKLNAFIDIWADAALEQARARDRELSTGIWRGPLHGIPLAHKDCFEHIGRCMTVGSRATPHKPAQRNAAAIERLNQAGAIDLGALNLSEMVAGPTGQNPFFGDCCNALDATRISGGSSSGSAVAVASGVVFGSVGSDTGGSIRLPASMNGLFGLKPTYGRVSRAGCFPRAFSLDCVGPLARSAQDCAYVLQAVAGKDSSDPTTLNAPVPDYIAGLDSMAIGSRVAVLDVSAIMDCDPQIDSAFTDFVSRSESRFGPVARISFPDLSACYVMGDIISKVEAATLHGQWMRENPYHYSQAVYSRTEPGLHVSAVRYLESITVRAQLLKAWLDGPMSHADILICPTIPIPVPDRVEADMEQAGRVFGVVAAITQLTRPFNYLGVPVLTMPIGYDLAGMPIGAQLIGRPLGEGRLLSVAHVLSSS